MAYVPPDFTTPGTELAVEIRNQLVTAIVVPLPFYKRPKKTTPTSTSSPQPESS
jgi:aminomethyltransferase